MEEEKKDNKKAGMRRALNVRDILNKKYDVFPFEGKWKDAFDTPEVRGCWFVWGNSGADFHLVLYAAFRLDDSGS